MLASFEGRSITALRNREAELIAQKKEAETRYFINASIDRETYNKLKGAVEPELKSIREDIEKFEDKMKKRKDAMVK
jgi:hypothetical protein